jgi:hypothetical protein
VSPGPRPNARPGAIREGHEPAGTSLRALARLSEGDRQPPAYFAEFLGRALALLDGVAGAVWLVTAPGRLQLVHQVNGRHVGLGLMGQDQEPHHERLADALRCGRVVCLAPQTGSGNPTPYTLLGAPVRVDSQVVGLVEVWQPAGPRGATGRPLRLLRRLAECASLYLRERQRRQALGQQELWRRLDSFAQRAHGSLNPAEVAYLLAAEGRRLLPSDRLSVALRRGRGVRVEAVSGVEKVDRRSALVRLMRTLCERVLRWGEVVIYTGTRDESLPPALLEALDAYLAHSNSTLLVVLPVREPREADACRPPRTALLAECFGPGVSADQLIGRLEAIARPAATALYNAAEFRGIPLRWLWRPLGWLREGMGGAARVGLAAAVVAVAAVAAALAWVPYPLKVDAAGQLLPQERRWVYAPVEGQIIRFEEGIRPGTAVVENQSLVQLYDVQLEMKLVQLANEIATAREEIAGLARQQASAPSEADRLRLSAERKQKEYLRDRKLMESRALRDRTHADEARPGYFWLRSPLDGIVLNWDFREKLVNRFVKPSEPLLRIGDPERPWEVELKIPQKYMAQILRAFTAAGPGHDLDVDLLLASAPTRVFRGKLARDRLAAEAVPDPDGGDPGAVVLASVRVEGPDLAEADVIPYDLLVTGTEVHSKVRCGDHPLGYSLFWGLWEFFCEKVVFFF